MKTTIALAFFVTAAQTIAAPIKLVILSGANVHDWKATTPFLQKMYADSGRFEVVRTVDDVSKVTDATFADVDVIVSNWTCHPIMTGGPWTEEGKNAFSKAIRGGKGMVSFHAASAACNDWADFQEISGLTWKLDFTSHTSYHTFKVVISDNKHAITRGMTDFWITDELYQRMVKMSESEFQTQAQAFANRDVHGTGAWEPMLITTRLGKGRGVNLLLGHDVHALQNIAWQTLMLRATEWAAGEKVTIPIPENWPTTPAAAALVGLDLDAVIQAATQYTHGQAREPLFGVEQFVNDATSRTAKDADARRAELAGRLGAAIAVCKTPEAKSFFCKQLGMIGTAEQVPAIAPLIRDEHTAMMARFALERIPGPVAGAALRDALPDLKDALLIGALDSIGQRADADSTLAVATFLRDADTKVAVAAAPALGRIGRAEAAASLRQARADAAEPVRDAITDACLTCAERLLAGGDKENSAGIYKLLYAPAEPPVVRAAALRGLVRSQPSQANLLYREAFQAGVPEVIAAVIDLTRELPKVGDTKLIAAAAMRLPADAQARMIAALADRGDKGAAASIRRGMDSDSEPVRLAIIAALAGLGDDTDVVWLADRAANGSDAERVAALESLRLMPVRSAEEAITGLLISGDAAMQSRAATALVNRPAKDKVFELLESVKDESVQVALLRVLDQIGDEKALAVLQRVAGSDQDAERKAALEALTRWSDSAASPVLLEAMRDARNKDLRPAMIAAIIRMTPQANEASEKETIGLVGQLLAVTERTADKELLLNMLSKHVAPEAMAAALPLVKQPDAAAAATAVVLKIAARLADTHQEQVALAMREILVVSQTPEVTQQVNLILRKTKRPLNLARQGVADSPDGLEADGQASGDQAAIDGDPATYWDETDGQKLYRYRVTFKEPAKVSAILIEGYAFESFVPRDFEVLCDDKVVQTVRGAVYSREAVEAFCRFEPVTCKSVELRITGCYGGSPAIRELGIYDWPADASSGTQPASSQTGS